MGLIEMNLSILNHITWEQCKLLEMLQQPITDGPHETPSKKN